MRQPSWALAFVDVGLSSAMPTEFIPFPKDYVLVTIISNVLEWSRIVITCDWCWAVNFRWYLYSSCVYALRAEAEANTVKFRILLLRLHSAEDNNALHVEVRDESPERIQRKRWRDLTMPIISSFSSVLHWFLEALECIEQNRLERILLTWSMLTVSCLSSSMQWRKKRQDDAIASSQAEINYTTRISTRDDTRELFVCTVNSSSSLSFLDVGTRWRERRE